MPKIWAITLVLLSFATASSQTPASTSTLHFAMPTGAGSIEVPLDLFNLEAMFLYDEGTRPVLQLKNSQPSITVSVILFPNGSAAPTAEGCRDDVISPLRKRFSSEIVSKTFQEGELTSTNGPRLAIASYFLRMAPDEIAAYVGDPLQLNSFAFYGDKNICAEIHASASYVKRSEKPSIFDDLFKQFKIVPDFQATSQDYGKLASILYRTKEFASAAIYYDRALTLLPPSMADPHSTPVRFLTDQLAMSYGLSGDLKHSRAINEAAIAKDPDYPLYYYNLACADAESNDATAARTHLQQAFDRRANTLPGEHLPNPTTDDSFLKLKKDKAFWAFAQSLQKN